MAQAPLASLGGVAVCGLIGGVCGVVVYGVWCAGGGGRGRADLTLRGGGRALGLVVMAGLVLGSGLLAVQPGPGPEPEPGGTQTVAAPRSLGTVKDTARAPHFQQWDAPTPSAKDLGVCAKSTHGGFPLAQFETTKGRWVPAHPSTAP